MSFPFLLFEIGEWGIARFLTLTWVVLRRSGKGIVEGRNETKKIYIGYLLILCSMLIHNIVMAAVTVVSALYYAFTENLT